MSKLLRDAGEALYGAQWQAPLSRDLGVADRTLRRWLAGADDLPAGVAMDLWRLAEERSLKLDEVMERLKEASMP